MNTVPRLWLATLCAMLALLAHARACSVPVFRYALDRWHADPYHLELAARDAADPEVARFARNLGANSGLNLELHRLPEESNAPSRLLRPPHGDAAPVPVWSGSLSAQSLAALTTSPTRSEIIARILQGQSAVWVLVEGADTAANNAAAALLEKRLRYLETVVQLPVIDPNDPSSTLGPGPALKVEFSLLRLPHASPEETTLRAMLAGPRSGLEHSNAPWIATVFGRGRTLGAWPAKDLDDAAIEEVALFLLGACSCQVKRQNPGWDLLLHFDWDEKLAALGVPSLPETKTPPSREASPQAPSTTQTTAPKPLDNAQPTPAADKGTPPATASTEAATAHTANVPTTAPVPITPDTPTPTDTHTLPRQGEPVTVRITPPEENAPDLSELLTIPAILLGMVLLLGGLRRRNRNSR